MKKLIVLFTVFVLIFSLAACGKEGTAADTDADVDAAEDAGNTEEIVMGGDMIPGGFWPEIMVNGKLYTWTRLAVKRMSFDTGDGGTEVMLSGDGTTFLPDGYTEIGEISGVTAETPTEDLQLMAGFDATGMVFTSETTPEVVYILLTTDWIEAKYVRFVSGALRDGECIAYNGTQYRISIGTGICELVKELPETCKLIGTLKYVGDDTVPAGDLETNCVSDTYGKAINGREVYADPEDLSVIYVYEHQYWAQGDYSAYLACRLWDENEFAVSGLVMSYGFNDGRGFFQLSGDDGKEYGFVITDETELVWEDTSAFSVWEDDALEGDRWQIFGGMLYVDVVVGDKTESENKYVYESVDGWYIAENITVTGTDERYFAPFGMAAKPVIYLYPETETEVEVTLDYNGTLTCTYPKYNNGWHVTASPDGTLRDENGQEYNYLYWEGKAAIEFDFSKGFCVKGEDTAAFLEIALSKLGLARREANEFIVYWLPLMESNAYNIIAFQGSTYTESAVLNITPTPDTVLRVYMAWKASDTPIQIEPQELSAPVREGFTVVEWGGTEVK